MFKDWEILKLLKPEIIKSKKGFTLVEILVVIAIISVISVVVVVVINPAEHFKSARDSQRIADLNLIDLALTELTTSVRRYDLGSSNKVYISLPDTSPDCENILNDLPLLPEGWSYGCTTAENLRKIDGSGWIPVDFTKITFGSSMSTLPVDPKNTAENELFYTYTPGSWHLTAKLESEKQSGEMEKTGNNSLRYDVGSNLALADFIGTAYDVSCNPPDTGRWTITERIVCADRTISVDELVYIQSGGELHLHNVIFNMDHSSTSQTVLRVYNGGKLYSNDTLFTSSLSGSRTHYIAVYSGGEAYFDNATLIGAPTYIRFRNYGYAEIDNSDFDYVNYFYSSSETIIRSSHIRSPYLYVESGHEMEVNDLDYTNTNLTYTFISNNGFRLASYNSHLRSLRLFNTYGKLTLNNSNIYGIHHYNYNANKGTFLNNSYSFLIAYYAYQSGQVFNLEGFNQPLSGFTGDFGESSNNSNLELSNSNISRIYLFSANGETNIKDSSIYLFYGLTNSTNELNNINVSYRFHLYSNSNNTIINSNINASRLYVYNTSQTELINSSLDSGNFRFYNGAVINSDNSTLNRIRLTSGSPQISGFVDITNFVSWASGVTLTRELPFKVSYSNLSPAGNVNVEIFDGGLLIDSGLTDSQGMVELTIEADNSVNPNKQYEVKVGGQFAQNISILESTHPEGIELVGDW